MLGKALPGGESGKRALPTASNLVLPVLVPLLLAGHVAGLWWLDRWSLGVAFEAYFTWQRALANAAIGLVAMLLLGALTRRLLASIVVIAGLHVLVFVASSIKLGLLGVPVILQDAYFLTGLDASGMELLANYVHPSAGAVFGVLAAVVSIAVLFWLERPWCRRFGWVQAMSVVVAVALLASLHAAAWPWTTRWFDKAHVRPSPLGLTPAAFHGGLLASLVYYHGVQRHRHFHVDDDALRAALKRVGGGAGAPAGAAPASDGARPDIVIVLSESFMDPRALNGMDEMPDQIPAIRAQIEAGNGGYMRAPAFGGGTVRTEFEVLTGMPVAAFPGVYYPYVDLDPGVMPGIVSTLEEHGYASFAVHGNSGAFWNRANTYKEMGVDRFLTQRDLERAGGRHDGRWLSDASMTDALLAELQHASEPTIAIAISIESHGPYDNTAKLRAPGDRAAIRLPETLDAGAGEELRSYLYHLHHADEQFARLLARLRARPRPFVLLFFGDHLPALAHGAYDELGFVDGQPAGKQFVPWALVSNAGAPPTTAGGQAIRAWQLPAMVLRAAGIRGDAYFDFTARVGERLGPVGVGRLPRLRDGLNAGAIARLQRRFDDYAKAP